MDVILVAHYAVDDLWAVTLSEAKSGNPQTAEVTEVLHSGLSRADALTVAESEASARKLRLLVAPPA
ncbi:MAG: hypothetical protein ACYCXX_11350 [Acidiferrobacter thiooxydans]